MRTRGLWTAGMCIAAALIISGKAYADACEDAVKAANNEPMDKKLVQLMSEMGPLLFSDDKAEKANHRCRTSAELVKALGRRLSLSEVAAQACGKRFVMKPLTKGACTTIGCLQKTFDKSKRERDEYCVEAAKQDRPLERARDACDRVLGDSKDKVAACTRMLALPEATTADRVFALTKRAHWRDQNKEKEAILDDLSHAIKLDPKNAKAWLDRAGAWPLDQKDRGIEDASKAIELNPKDPHAWSTRAMYYGFKDDHVRQERDLREALKLDPKDTFVWTSLIEVHTLTKDYDGAMKLVAELKKIDEAIGGMEEDQVKAAKELFESPAHPTPPPVAYVPPKGDPQCAEVQKMLTTLQKEPVTLKGEEVIPGAYKASTKMHGLSECSIFEGDEGDRTSWMYRCSSSYASIKAAETKAKDLDALTAKCLPQKSPPFRKTFGLGHTMANFFTDAWTSVSVQMYKAIEGNKYEVEVSYETYVAKRH